MPYLQQHGVALSAGRLVEQVEDAQAQRLLVVPENGLGSEWNGRAAAIAVGTTWNHLCTPLPMHPAPSLYATHFHSHQ